jgi:2-polyprenyl-6-methoxyphenol hydroxylase-like FAD-dependent oxidoreductase
MDNPDIVVVGGGIAGGSFAMVMAKAGFSVLMLEITREHRDVVRGEAMTPWGVAEAQKIGTYDLFMRSGGHHPARFTVYDEDVDPAEAEANALDFKVLPFPPLMCLGHPTMCNALDEAAVASGARFLRGVRHARVTPGSPPSVSFEHDGTAYELKPRLVVGADGRHGQTRRQIGVVEHADPLHHWMAGLLVEDAHDWPAGDSFLGVEGWRNYIAFPQGDGRIRLYLCFAVEDRARLMGPEGPAAFLDAYRLKSVPGSEAIAAARPVSEIFGYPNNDVWTDEPYAEGVVLIGDAAGYTDPIIGQGLGMAQRDVGMVSEILTSNGDWSAGAFRSYGQERAERTRRMRNIGRFAAVRDSEFTPEARERRKRVAARTQERPELMASVQAPFVGPDVLPPQAYEMETISALLA